MANFIPTVNGSFLVKNYILKGRFKTLHARPQAFAESIFISKIRYCLRLYGRVRISEEKDRERGAFSG